MAEVSTTSHLAELREQLDSIGDRRRDIKRLQAEVAKDAPRVLAAAVEAGIPITEIHRRAEYSRRWLYDKFPAAPADDERSGNR